MIEEDKKCVQCGRGIKYKVTLDSTNPFQGPTTLFVCTILECPNLGLYQTGV